MERKNTDILSYQKELGLAFRMSNSKYRFYRLAGKEMTIPEAKTTLYYNEPICETETILFSPNELTQSNFEVWKKIYTVMKTVTKLIRASKKK